MMKDEEPCEVIVFPTPKKIDATHDNAMKPVVVAFMNYVDIMGLSMSREFLQHLNCLLDEFEERKPS